MNNGKLDFAIAGTGAFSEHHAKTIKTLPSANLLGVYSSSKERADSFSQKYNCTPFYDLNSLINSSVDVIVIANKNNEHFKLAEAAITNKKHVIIEKPFAITNKEMNSLILLSKKNNVKAISFLEFRYAEAYKKAKEIIDSGRLGKILSINIEVFQNKNLSGWKSEKSKGGGLLFMYLIHYIDILFFLTSRKVENIYASLRGKDVEKTANILISFKDFDVTISSSCSCRYDKQDKIEIIGENSSLTILDNQRIIEENKSDTSKLNRITKRLLGILGIALGKVTYFKSLDFSSVYKDFINSIKENNENICSLEKTKPSLELILNLLRDFKIKSEEEI